MNHFECWLKEQDIPFFAYSNEEQRCCLQAYIHDQYTQQKVAAPPKDGRKVYYTSMEVLPGRLLTNDLLALDLYRDVADYFQRHGDNLGKVEDAEIEPSLGNGGLGRLAACILESLATLGYRACGIGLLFRNGLFRQKFQNRQQTAQPDTWDHESLIPCGSIQSVTFATGVFRANCYELPVLGADGNCVPLHLFEIRNEEATVTDPQHPHDPQDLCHRMNDRLYPDDSTPSGRLLRISQEYFLSDNAAQLILRECQEAGVPLQELYRHAAVHINDTHPVLVIPALVYYLTKSGIPFRKAADVVTKTCSFTNHTILKEALEVWGWEELAAIVPHLMPVISRLDDLARERSSDERTYIANHGKVHMAHIAIHFSSYTNGVAELHTEILKNTELNHFYRLYPERFCNVTNGITFRRWLYNCNPELTALLESVAGPGIRENPAELTRLLDHYEDPHILATMLECKNHRKKELQKWLQTHQGVTFDPDSIVMVQAKRFHAYKRQQLNALWIIDRIHRIRAGELPPRKITVILGGKAAVSYIFAKNVIHLILCLSELIRKDPLLSQYLDVIMVENYNVTAAEKLLPAADVSEQISLASKEASGTGNFKMMVNGAVTLGTLDGANVEIRQAVGPENFYLFGDTSETVIRRYQEHSYHPMDWYRADPQLQRAVDFITTPEMMALGDGDCLNALRQELLYKDEYMTFPDFRSYVAAKDQVLQDYEDRIAWAKKMLVNVAKAGFFSCDRTVQQYAEQIWKL